MIPVASHGPCLDLIHETTMLTKTHNRLGANESFRLFCGPDLPGADRAAQSEHHTTLSQKTKNLALPKTYFAYTCMYRSNHYRSLGGGEVVP